MVNSGQCGSCQTPCRSGFGSGSGTWRGLLRRCASRSRDTHPWWYCFGLLCRD
ncbi:Uncharacterised protein [Vibrio cholerae]|nr:Uncharacterised protein [Vibrio cholerae]